MKQNPQTIVPESIRQLVSLTSFIALRWETPYTPCAGITAVVKQERRIFCRRELIVAPWQDHMKVAGIALAEGKVRDTGGVVVVARADDIRKFRLLMTDDDQSPMVFLASEKSFKGVQSPYDTADLKEDTLAFAEALEELLTKAGARPHQFIWGADWETVPAMLLQKCKGRTTVLHIHNIIDDYLGDVALRRGFQNPETLLHRSVLQAGFACSNVAVTVNRGYCYALRYEPLYTQIMASHLREELARLVPLDNPPFEPLSLELVALESQLDRDPQGGLARLREFKQAARKSLPPNLEQQIAGKALVVIMGRRTSQKGHDVAVAAIRRLFLANPTFPAFFFFATTGGDETSPVRLERIVGLCREFPSRCAYSDGRLSYFNQLMAAADFNCMPSLGEPHGGAFQSSVIPIARGIDGLAAQICPLEPVGEAVRLRDLFHPAGALPSGFTFREDPLADSGRSANEVRDILVNPTPAPHNETLARMTVALARVVKQAVSIHATEPGRYARLVQGALRAQMVRTWEMNLGGVLALVDAARV